MKEIDQVKVIKNRFGYWEVAEKPSQKDLQEYYAKKYYQEAKGSYELEYSAEELNYFQAKISQRWAVIRRYLSIQEGSLLDVGCGEGYTLSFFRKIGWNVKGFDFSAAGVQSKNPSCQDALVTGDVFALLEKEIESGTRHDVIWLQNVLEHVLDPQGLLESLRSIISREGILLVTVPNDFSKLQTEAKKLNHIDKEFWVAPPDHLNYFSATSLERIGAATGWRCLDILGDFPIDWFLFHPESNYVMNKAAGKPAHRARVSLENLINESPVEDVVSFWSALAKIGMGRDITAFFRPAAISL